MRTVYPGLYYPDEKMAVEVASAIARMTHHDDKSTDACVLYTRMIHLIIEVESCCPTSKGLMNSLKRIFQYSDYDIDAIRVAGKEALRPTGYSVDSFVCALYALWETDSFEEAVATAANLGGDADTIAAITGGLAGALYGFDAIPERWVAALSQHDRDRLDAAVETAVKSRRGEH